MPLSARAGSQFQRRRQHGRGIATRMLAGGNEVERNPDDARALADGLGGSASAADSVHGDRGPPPANAATPPAALTIFLVTMRDTLEAEIVSDALA